MKVTYPAEQAVSIWIGTFQSEDDFDRCVDESVGPALGLDIDLAEICEVGFECDSIAVRDLLNGFSGSDTFVESAEFAASAHNLSLANSALVCYHLHCDDAPAEWGALRFLGSFSGQDAV
ncbi:MAG: hypothetical protein V4662_12310 [Verrucomicrobiota bacterium]